MKTTIQNATACGAIVVASLALPSHPARAAGSESARVRVAGALIDDVVRGLLPVILPEPSAGTGGADGARPMAFLSELRYCGVTEKGAGRFRAVIRQGSPYLGSSPLLLARDVCHPSLAELAKRAPAQPERADGVAIADIEANWKPWELRLALARSVVLGPAKSGRMPELEDSRGLWTITTSDLRIPIDAGEPIILHAAPSFAAAALDIAVILGERGSVAPSGRKGAPAALVGEANISADVPVSFANQILRRLTGTQPLSISVDRDVVDLEKLAMAQEKAGLTIRGDATPQSIRETAHLAVAVDGEDLRVASVRAEGQADECAGLGAIARVACNLRSGASGVVGETLAAALTQRYQGQLVRDLIGQQEFRFNVGGQPLDVHGELLRLACGAGGLSAVARFGTGSSRREGDSAR